MSRLARKPVMIPKGVQISLSDDRVIRAKGSKGEDQQSIHPDVDVNITDSSIEFSPKSAAALAMTGTMRALVVNLCKGVSEGYEKKLSLVGVGYRAKAEGNNLNITLGYSHPIDYPIPDGITIETPSQTEITVKGIDRQKVGQVAAEIRAFRAPEPYKGKGVKYADEQLLRKEAKKK